MRRLIIAVSAAAFLAASSIAALAEDVTGAIASVDAHANTVTLESGETFALPENFNAATFAAGQKVTITLQKGDGGHMVVLDIVPSS